MWSVILDKMSFKMEIYIIVQHFIMVTLFIYIAVILSNDIVTNTDITSIITKSTKNCSVDPFFSQCDYVQHIILNVSTEFLVYSLYIHFVHYMAILCYH